MKTVKYGDGKGRVFMLMPVGRLRFVLPWYLANDSTFHISVPLDYKDLEFLSRELGLPIESSVNGRKLLAIKEGDLEIIFIGR